MTNVKKLYSFQKLPIWFNGEIYSKGDTVKNPHYYGKFETYNKETHELTANELSMYFFLISANNLLELGLLLSESYKNMIKGRKWFMKNNPNAYYDLLDY